MKTKRILPFVLAAAMLLSACGGNSVAQSGEGAYTAGTYTGEGQGYGGTVTVTITTDANSILEVTAEGADETPTVGGAALEELAAQVKEAQSAEIDGVAGATLTSNGVKAAAQAAIDGRPRQHLLRLRRAGCRGAASTGKPDGMNGKDDRHGGIDADDEAVF